MDTSFHINNRQRLAAHMANNAMLFFSGESMRKSARSLSNRPI